MGLIREELSYYNNFYANNFCNLRSVDVNGDLTPVLSPILILEDDCESIFI